MVYSIILFQSLILISRTRQLRLNLKYEMRQQLLYLFRMGAECVRQSPKPKSLSYKNYNDATVLRDACQPLQFHIEISQLQLHCDLTSLSKVVFRVRDCFELIFLASDFTINDQTINSFKTHHAQFQVSAKAIEFLNFEALIYYSNKDTVEKLTLKMHAVCEGPSHHDHLLRKTKTRIRFNLDINQMVSVDLCCSSVKIESFESDQKQLNYAYSIQLLSSNQTDYDNHQKTIIPVDGNSENQKNIKELMSSNKLKQSIIRLSIYKLQAHEIISEYEQVLQIHIPYLKLMKSDEACLITDKKGRNIEKRKTQCLKQLKNGPLVIGNVFIQILCHASKIYLEQMDSHFYSEDGFKMISPLEFQMHSQSLENRISKKDLQEFIKIFKKQGIVSYSNKHLIKQSLKNCHKLLTQKEYQEPCKFDEIIQVQIAFVDFLNILSELFTHGECMTNIELWGLIDAIIHRPELSIKYLSLIDRGQIKQEIGIKFYTFFCNVMSKIIQTGNVGFQFRQLKCVQKFIGCAYFRFQWIQNVTVSQLKKQNDQILLDEKLMEIGAYPGSRNPAKDMLYNWQQCLYPDIKDLQKYKQLNEMLQDFANHIPHWVDIVYNRDDDNLFFGQLIQIWNEAETFLLHQGRILWQYFPKYGDLLGSFLGEMNKNQIVTYSKNFMECSLKLMSNDKLLNIFVKLLFQKTHLYKIFYVLKSLEIIHLYFEAISQSNKLIPKQFNYNYFYTGISSIFSSNHSILIPKLLVLLYDYYHIFNMDFKLVLDNFIFKKVFFDIFLHWSGYVRRLFYYFLEHRLTIKFHINLTDKNLKSDFNFSSIKHMYLYENHMKCLEEEEQIIKQSAKQSNQPKDIYYMRMIQKLKKGRLQKIKDLRPFPNRVTSMTESYKIPTLNKMSISDPPQNLNPEIQQMIKKYSARTQSGPEIFDQALPENLKKYIEAGMKEYRQIKICPNPDKNVADIIRKYENGKDTD